MSYVGEVRLLIGGATDHSVVHPQDPSHFGNRDPTKEKVEQPDMVRPVARSRCRQGVPQVVHMAQRKRPRHPTSCAIAAASAQPDSARAEPGRHSCGSEQLPKAEQL